MAPWRAGSAAAGLHKEEESLGFAVSTMHQTPACVGVQARASPCQIALMTIPSGELVKVSEPILEYNVLLRLVPAKKIVVNRGRWDESSMGSTSPCNPPRVMDGPRRIPKFLGARSRVI
ncbi:uncharacterized protein [Zea mays]|uniref:uncharacterized protein n=1 Tax=Zea mays TaxID=4577 RepID=UPI0004DE8ED2|nr:uncharacterized protein LOC103650840 [Zea mays]|eukprot:XP_008674648.1 uncharacterized protein LOC103650840 [Zea mays]